MTKLLTGGCQCGAVRYVCESLGRASICHCRMCQKAFGSYFGPFATAHGLTWTRGKPKYFQSSNSARRGFCGECGTPLCYNPAPGHYEMALGALDRPQDFPPAIQVMPEQAMPWFGTLAGLPTFPEEDQAKFAAYFGAIVSRQHPDHDTDAWPPEKGTPR